MDLGPAWTELGLWGLFLASFLAATVLPFSSELVLSAMALGPWSGVALWAVASLGNWLGGMSSYGLGRLGDLDRIVRWLRADVRQVERLQAWVRRYGHWTALMTWLPVVGDPLAIALGLARVRTFPVMVLMFVGKAVRYAMVLYLLRGGG